MIGYLRGTVEDVSEDSMILEVSGVGYNIMITGKEAELLPSTGEECKVYTYLSVREDAMKLYGFLTRDDLDFFKKLIAVNGIGPKGAQGILSAMNPDDLRFAILSGDAKTISKCPGIGAKTAQRIILDLKDKISLEDAFEMRLASHTGPVSDELKDNRKEAAEALTALGYSSTDALRAVKKVEHAEDMDVEALLKAALKNI